MDHKAKVEPPVLRPLQRGILLALASLIIYLLITVLTTPSLLPLDAIRVAFLVNWWVVAGLILGIAVQTFLISYSKKVCNLKKRRTLAAGAGSFSVFSSFLSFFALIPVGCCGSWLYILAFLPGVLGAGASGFIIKYSNSLTLVSFFLMSLSIIYTYISIRNSTSSGLELQQSRGVKKFA